MIADVLQAVLAVVFLLASVLFFLYLGFNAGRDYEKTFGSKKARRSNDP